MSKVNNSSTIEPTLQQQTINTSANIDANQKYGFIMGKIHTHITHAITCINFIEISKQSILKFQLQVNERIR